MFHSKHSVDIHIRSWLYWSWQMIIVANVRTVEWRICAIVIAIRMDNYLINRLVVALWRCGKFHEITGSSKVICNNSIIPN